MVANEENLVPFEGERAREMGRKGGKASGRSRRKRRSVKECMELLLTLPISDGDEYEKLAALGIDVDKTDNTMLIAVGLYQNAKTGNVPAFKELMSLLGEEEKQAGAASAELSKLYRALEREED